MQIFILVAVAFGWYQYSQLDSRPWWAFALLAVASLVAVQRLWRYHVATQAAFNVVAAVATYNEMSEEQQSTVHDRAIVILRRSGWRMQNEPDFEDDVERFGWYALAMAELGIRPVCLMKGWNLVRNPWREALNPNYYFETATKLAEKQGHSLTLLRPSHRR